MQNVPKPMHEHFSSIETTKDIDILDLRRIIPAIEQLLEKMIKIRTAVPLEELTDYGDDMIRRRSFIADDVTLTPHLQEALFLRQYYRDLLGTRDIRFVGRGLATKLFCPCSRLLTDSLYYVAQVYTVTSEEHKARFFASVPILLDLITGFVHTLLPDHDDEFLLRFVSAFGDLECSIDLGIDGEGKFATVDFCKLTRSIFNRVAVTYNYMHGFTAPDHDCEDLDMCLFNSRKSIMISGTEVSFSDRQLN